MKDKVVSVASNNTGGTMLLTENNNLYVCGINKFYCLDNNSKDYSTPLLINKPFSLIVSKIVLGYSNSLLLTNNGQVYTKGDNTKYQTGNMTTTEDIKEWFNLPLPNDHIAIEASACNEYFLLILKRIGSTEQRLFSIGKFDDGRSGVNTDSSYRLQPCFSVEHIDFSTCYSREDSSAAITSDGRLYTWGFNYYGSLGINSSESSIRKPTLVDCFDYKTTIVEHISISSNHSFVIAKENNINKLYSSGYYYYAATGHEESKIKYEEVRYNKDNGIPISCFVTNYQSFILMMNLMKKEQFTCLSSLNESSDTSEIICSLEYSTIEKRE